MVISEISLFPFTLCVRKMQKMILYFVKCLLCFRFLSFSYECQQGTFIGERSGALMGYSYLSNQDGGRVRPSEHPGGTCCSGPLAASSPSRQASEKFSMEASPLWPLCSALHQACSLSQLLGNSQLRIDLLDSTFIIFLIAGEIILCS